MEVITFYFKLVCSKDTVYLGVTQTLIKNDQLRVVTICTVH